MGKGQEQKGCNSFLPTVFWKDVASAALRVQPAQNTENVHPAGFFKDSERDVQSASSNRSFLIMTGSTTCDFQSAETRSEGDIKHCTVAISQTRSSWLAVWETKLTILWCSPLQITCSETWEMQRNNVCLYHIHEIITVHTKGLWEILYFHPIQLYNTPCFSSFQLWNSTLTQDVGFINYTTSNTFCNIIYFSFWIYSRIKCWSLGNTFSAFRVVTSITSPTGIPLILAMYSAAM